MDQRSIDFIWFSFIYAKNGLILNKGLRSFPNCLLQLTFSRTNQASSSSVQIVDYSNSPHTHLTSHHYTDYQTPSSNFRLRVMQWCTSMSCLGPHNHQLLYLVTHHFSSLYGYHFIHRALELNYVQKI